MTCLSLLKQIIFHSRLGWLAVVGEGAFGLLWRDKRRIVQAYLVNPVVGFSTSALKIDPLPVELTIDLLAEVDVAHEIPRFMLSDELVELRIDLDIALAKLAPQRVGIDLA